MDNITYYIYHIPGKKIGVTRDLENRVTKQQGYEPHEYEILVETEDIEHASFLERALQEMYGYEVDRVPYNKLKCNKMKMKINVTEQTTTFPCPLSKLKGQLMDNVGMRWSTGHGECIITSKSIKWIMQNAVTSMYNPERCYVYNKAFSRWFDNNNAYDLMGGNLEDVHMRNGVSLDQQKVIDSCGDRFDLIREWADKRGLYDNGDVKTQYVKLMEEAGEVGRAILKEDHDEVIDGIGDMVVVLTNLAELYNRKGIKPISIETCIDAAYDEIKTRKGAMRNGTFVKQESL